MTELSVVIPTFNRRESILRALRALERQDLPAAQFEAVVAIDGSDDGTAEALAALSTAYRLRTVAGPRRGRAGACNAGIRAAEGSIVVILDDDMEPAPSCLSAHRRHHTADVRVCVMGAAPIVVDAASPHAAEFMAWKFRMHLAALERPGHRFGLRDFYSGNTSLRRDVLVEAGLFDEQFTAYGNEDLELSLRLRAADVELRYDADALAHQHYEKDLAGLARDTFEKGTTAVLLARAHPETFEELQLADLRAHSRARRVLRALLLAARRPALVLAASRLLERARAVRRPMFYVLLLDYFYWHGVQSALAAQSDTGRLGDLAGELRHGAIGLLLHG
jgi:glycosyltransferase involved in cell wall biosynthesis